MGISEVLGQLSYNNVLVVANQSHMANFGNISLMLRCVLSIYLCN